VEINRSQIHFLDITISKSNGKVVTDIHYKITDSHMYLHFHSLHPGHIKRNIPYSLSYRINRIVSCENLKKIRLQELKQYLLSLNYPCSIIDDAINKKYDIKPRISIDTKKLIPFVMPSNKTSVEFTNTFFYPIIKNICDEHFVNHRLIKCMKQPPNLLRSLQYRNYHYTKKCQRSKCKTCNIILERKDGIYFKNVYIKFNCNMTCITDNLIYVLICNGCSKIYVGETGNKLNIRTNLHRNHICNEHYGFLPVSKHIRNCNDASFSICPIYRLQIQSEYLRKSIEKYFISVIKPELNSS